MRLEDKTHQQFKVKTVQDNVSIQKLIQEIIESYINTDINAFELLERIKK